MKKHIFLLMAVIATMVSCAKFDYEAIFEQLRDHEERIQKLETMCNQLNTNITALQAILEAISGNDYVTNVVKIMENGKEIGYSISFAKSGTVTIYHGADGSNGSDGAAPKIGIRKASDGEYYWTADDEWLTDESGAKIPASVPNDPDGKYITPSFRVAEGEWYISYDGGNTWQSLGKFIGQEEEPFFKDVSYDGRYLYITLPDGTPVTIPTSQLIEEMKNITSEVRLAKQYDLVVGDHFQLFYTGVVKTFNIKNEGIRVECAVGRQMPRYFEYTPTESDAGQSYKLTITTRRLDGSVISLGETTLVVHPKLTDSTTPANVNVLIIGDSLTYQGEWAGEGLRRVYGSDLSVSPVPLGLSNTCTSYGTKSHVINGFRVYHEGYSGWSWARFLQSSSPFYNATSKTIDFKNHAARYNNPGADLIAILMSWNGSGVTADFDFSEAINRNLNDAATIIRQAHSDFPNAKIICLGLQISCLNGGTGMWYGATGGLSDMYGTAFYAFDYSKALEEMVTNEEFGEYCFYIDTKGQFDTEYNTHKTEVSVNDRNNTDKEVIGTNGVHPTTAGYYQIGDAFYRGLHRVLPLIAETKEEPVVDLDITNAKDLSASETANCYIVSEPGIYKFLPTKGCSNESVGNIVTSALLWKSFGTSTIPAKEDLITVTCFKDGYIGFEVPADFKEGNAVIAAKDADGSVLWSWHIWLTDQPQEQVYKNNAGTMMDRNLGATSATPGDAGALGLLYQWGRKDPFLGSSSTSKSVAAKSLYGNWQVVSSSKTTGTIGYTIAHPTVFITQSSNGDWYYTGSASTDNTRWTTSDKEKSIYDPCPAGWRVPDGGEKGIWAKASGKSASFAASYDSANKGINFSGTFGESSTIWYPAVGYIHYTSGTLKDTGVNGVYWSASTVPDSSHAYCMITREDSTAIPFQNSMRSFGRGLRCTKE
jgi:uncharacterized protein (TIGR02145 family)